MRIYEGMFVLDDARCNDNWEAVTREVRRLLEKNQAEIFTCERWDERRLAYTIKGRTRAVYLLTRFTAPSEAIGTIERDCQLNDTVLRVLIVRDTHSERLHRAGLFLPKEDAGPQAAEAQPQEGSPQEEPPKDQPPPPAELAAEQPPAPEPPAEEDASQGPTSPEPSP